MGYRTSRHINEVRIGIACEDNGHFRAVSCLIDQRCLAAHDWLDGVLDDCRRWIGQTTEDKWLKLSSVSARDIRANKTGGRTFKRHGHIAGEPLKPEAAMWRRVLDHFSAIDPRPEVVVLARDSDGQARRASIIQVRDGILWPFQVVMAVAIPEVEAWYVSGFEPESPEEKARLERLTQDLSFNPTTQSHRLTSHPNDSMRDAKRVLKELCGTDEARQRTCLLDERRLHNRGKKNGMSEFLDEVAERIVPIFSSGE